MTLSSILDATKTELINYILQYDTSYNNKLYRLYSKKKETLQMMAIEILKIKIKEKEKNKNDGSRTGS